MISPPTRRVVACLLLGALIACYSVGFADEKPAPERLRASGIDGAVIVCGGNAVPDAAAKEFVKLAGGDKATIVVIPAVGAKATQEAVDQHLTVWTHQKTGPVTALQLASRKGADDAKFLEPLRQATGVWLGGEDLAYLAEMIPGTALEKELRAVLARGGVVGAHGPAATFLGRHPVGNAPKGLDLLPGTMLETQLDPKTGKSRLPALLDKNPGTVGISLPEGAAVVLKGRDLGLLGSGTVSVSFAAGAGREAETRELKPGVTDWTQLRRIAIARTQTPYPPKELPVPEVPKGSLVIVGGGGMPADVTKKFLDLAGGPDAPIVVLPVSNPDPVPGTSGNFLKKAGATNVTVLPGRELKGVEDPKNLEAIKKAKAVWFDGGRQWRFVDAYEGTKAHDLFRDVLNRGGVIGGSSAGATIQGDYLCRGAPAGPNVMMADGYERALGFLPGVGIDQHFTQRNRFPDMTAFVKKYPQFLGIGLDEATAIVVQGHTAEVMGRGQVHFYDKNKPAEAGKDYESVKAGGKYDLKARKILDPGKGGNDE